MKQVARARELLSDSHTETTSVGSGYPELVNATGDGYDSRGTRFSWAPSRSLRPNGQSMVKDHRPSKSLGQESVARVFEGDIPNRP